ncbi:integrase, partial [Mesorhizobium sp. M7A.F.Ca.US.006.01.1.1]
MAVFSEQKPEKHVYPTSGPSHGTAAVIDHSPAEAVADDLPDIIDVVLAMG